MLMHNEETTRKEVTIRKNDFDEYEVPDGDDFYHTDDRDDAVATACLLYGAEVTIRFRRVQS